MLLATFKLCAGSSYRHMRNMKGELLGPPVQVTRSPQATSSGESVGLGGGDRPLKSQGCRSLGEPVQAFPPTPYLSVPRAEERSWMRRFLGAFQTLSSPASPPGLRAALASS